MIRYPIPNDYITVKFDDGNVGLNTELCQRGLIQVFFRGLHIYMLKKASRISVVYDEKVFFCISDTDIQFILPPQLQNMTQRHKIMCSFKIFIQAATYQKFLNNWCKS